MLKLDLIQEKFMQALLDNTVKLDFISSPNEEERLNIYRQTVFENLRSALEITFAGIWQLIGKACADEIARAYFCNKNNLPQSGCLEDWGEGFPAFLKTIPALQPLVYLNDYATYEWQKKICLNCTNHSFTHINELNQYKSNEVEQLQFKINPSYQLIYSPFPLWAIESVIEDPSREEIHLNMGESWGYITQFKNQTMSYWLKRSEWEFIQNISQGLTLGEASQKAIEQCKEFDLAKIIYFLFATNSINKIYFKG